MQRRPSDCLQRQERVDSRGLRYERQDFSPHRPATAQDTRSYTASPERYSADSSKTYDSISSTSYSRRCPSNETLSQRSSSEPRSDHMTEYVRSRSPGGERRSLTASDSSLEDLALDGEAASSRRSSRRSRIVKQKRSLPSDDRDAYPVFQDSGHRLFVSDTSSFKHSTQTLQHIPSDSTLHFDFPSTVSPHRRRSDSPTSEYSDVRGSSPPGESMSPCSPDFSRSPRQSGDSDLITLHLRELSACV